MCLEKKQRNTPIQPSLSRSRKTKTRGAAAQSVKPGRQHQLTSKAITEHPRFFFFFSSTASNRWLYTQKSPRAMMCFSFTVLHTSGDASEKPRLAVVSYRILRRRNLADKSSRKGDGSYEVICKIMGVGATVYSSILLIIPLYDMTSSPKVSTRKTLVSCLSGTRQSCFRVRK